MTTNEEEMKDSFAKAWLNYPDDPFKAACSIFGSDTGKALYAAKNWINDPYVMAEKKRLSPEFVPDIPTKEQLAFELLVTVARNPVYEAKDRIAAYNSVAKWLGYEKQGDTLIGNNVTHNVLIVRDLGSNDDWEIKCLEQQKKLTDATRH